MDSETKPISEVAPDDETECKRNIKEYFRLTRQIAELSQQRTELSKHLIPAIERTGLTNFELTGGHKITLYKSARPKPFNKKYLNAQISDFMRDDAQAERLMKQLNENRETVEDSRIVVKMAEPVKSPNAKPTSL